MDKKKLRNITNKIIIHTFIDIINSILEVKNKKYHLYENISNKFFSKLYKLYNNEELINTLKDIDSNKMTIASKIKREKLYKNIQLPSLYEKTELVQSLYFNRCRLSI